MSKKIAFQGIPGSFHHQVALMEYGESAKLLSFAHFEGVAKAVAEGSATAGVMAIENSIAGAILPNYDLIDRYGLHIQGEFYLPISHQLMALEGQQIQDLHEVRSHPMALLQCKSFLENYPHLEQIQDVDTASVAKRIAAKKLQGVAAIGSEIAAKIYGLEILARGIQTIKTNFTRFILLGNSPTPDPLPPTKASIKITIRNEAGGLAGLLTHLSAHGLDLSKIQSIPVIEKPWEYAFFIDAKFDDPLQFEQAMQQVREKFGTLKILGTYHARKA